MAYNMVWNRTISYNEYSKKYPEKITWLDFKYNCKPPEEEIRNSKNSICIKLPHLINYH